jgi:primosomal protein N'
LTRDGRVLWSPETSSHEDIIRTNNLEDNKLKDRDFVRLEIAPKIIWSKKKADWKFKVDEEKTLPKWYSDAPKKWEALVWREWRSAMKQTLWKLNLDVIEEVVEEVKRIDYFDMHGEPDPDWNLTPAPSWAAARDAARAAAGAAAGAAAWAAAWDAAWDAALYVQVKLTDGIDQKHIDHANARMDVWRKGYALYCDVNGKLYVYGVKKEAK